MDRDLALIERLARLHPAVVADCLDRRGLRKQVLAPHIRPLAHIREFVRIVRQARRDVRRPIA